VRHVLSERLVAILGPYSRWNGRMGLRSVASEPFSVIARSRLASFHDHVLNVCAAAGFAPRVVQEVFELFTAVLLVRAGLGVALVPRSAVLMRLPGVRFEELGLPQAAWNIALVWRFLDAVPAVPVANATSGRSRTPSRRR
jgi:DNA-binding transcriptional LysR family regulator